MCDNGRISSCMSTSERLDKHAAVASKGTPKFLFILVIILSILILSISLFGGAILFLKKRRMAQPFSHARLTDNVEITNPMYLADIDDPPAFVHEDDKGNFANPVYESMYAGSTQDTEIVANSSIAPDERKGLLQDSHDEPNTQDIL